MWNDYRGRAVLVTGGTRGIGLATGLAFVAVLLVTRFAIRDRLGLLKGLAR